MIGDYISRKGLNISYTVTGITGSVSFETMSYDVGIKELKEAKVAKLGKSISGLVTSIKLYIGSYQILHLRSKKAKSGERGDLVALKVEAFVTCFFGFKIVQKDPLLFSSQDSGIKPLGIQKATKLMTKKAAINGFAVVLENLAFCTEIDSVWFGRSSIMISEVIQKDKLRVSYSTSIGGKKSEVDYATAQKMFGTSKELITRIDLDHGYFPIVSFVKKKKKDGLQGGLLIEKIDELVHYLLNVEVVSKEPLQFRSQAGELMSEETLREKLADIAKTKDYKVNVGSFTCFSN